MFVVDSSGSIRDNNPEDESYDNWELMLDFVVTIVEDLDIGSDKTRVGMVRYSNFASNIFYLDSYFDKQELIDAILSVSYDGGTTNIYDGIRLMHEQQFTASFGDRPDADNIAIVITDGVSTENPGLAVPEAIEARNENIKIYTVGITDEIDRDELREMSSMPQLENQNYFISPDFQGLEAIGETLRDQACTGVLANCAILVADIVIMLDSSSSMSSGDWSNMKEFAADFVEELPISSNGVRVGLVRFADNADNIFYLDRYTSMSSVTSEIRNLNFIGGGTNIGNAIEAMHFDQFVDSRGDRSSVRNIAVLITDGESSGNHENTLAKARAAQEDGIEIFVVGITSSVDEDEILSIASYPHILNGNYWIVDRFSELLQYVGPLGQYVCLDHQGNQNG